MTRFRLRASKHPSSGVAALCYVMAGLLLSSIAGAQVYTQGLPTVGNPNSTNAAASQMSIDATQFTTAADMCDSISQACAKLANVTPKYPAGATIDARGFTGNQVCAATNATTMLFGCVNGTGHNGGKLLLGNVNLYVDGPIPPATSYTDNGTPPSGVGTPAIIIPSMFWGIEGITLSDAFVGSYAWNTNQSTSNTNIL